MKTGKVLALACCLVLLVCVASAAQADARKLVETEFQGCDFELLHLEQLAAELRERAGARGYIVVYAPGVGSKPDTALAYAARMRRYLVVARGLEASRVKVVDGGFREKLGYEVWLVPRGAALPAPRPTVPRRAVRLRRGKTRLRSCGEILG